MGHKNSSPVAVESLILQEALWRREEADSALSNLYLRGTVLIAVAISEIGLVDSSKSCPAMSWTLLTLLVAAAYLGLMAFWPRKKSKYKLQTIKSAINKDVPNSERIFREFVTKDYEDVEKSIKLRMRFLKAGFIMCAAVLPLLVISMMGIK